MRKCLLLLVALMSFWGLCACAESDSAPAKVRDMEFTVVAKNNIPEELYADLEDKKETPFTLTYADRDFLYICVGYGEQKTGGYSISVEEVYLTKDAVYVDTSLLGPTPEEAETQVASYPYIVLQTEYVDKSVIFE